MTLEPSLPNDQLGGVLHDSIIELMNDGGTDAWGAAEMVCETRPDLQARFGREAIEARAEEMLGAELSALAGEFERLFGEFNKLYFGGALAEYQIRVRYDIDAGRPGDPGEFYNPNLGFIEADERRIWIRVASEETMISTLLHEMAHAVTGGEHDEAWQEEMRRLWDLGAKFDWTEGWLGAEAYEVKDACADEE